MVNIPEGNRYLIVTNRPQAGFFSSFIQVLGELHYCELNGITPVVFFSSNWVYWQRSGYQGAINGWEYYFEPVSEARISDLTGKDETYLEHCNIFDFEEERIIPNFNPKHVYDLSRKGHVPLPPNVTAVNRWPAFHLGTDTFLEENRDEANRLIQQHIRIHPEILAIAESFHARHMADGEIVGVHFRGLERRFEIEDWHGLEFAQESRYIEEIDAYLCDHPAAKLFIATDTESSLNIFLDHYGDRCLYYPSTRSTGDSSPHMQFGGAKIGEEILIEGLLLSRSDHLVHGISNVAFAALAMNPELRHVDVYHSRGSE